MAQCQHGKYDADLQSIFYCVKDEYICIHQDNRGRIWTSDESNFAPITEPDTGQTDEGAK